MDYEGRASFYYAYSSLVLYSFGLENALEVNRTHTRWLVKLTLAEAENGYFVLFA